MVPHAQQQANYANHVPFPPLFSQPETLQLLFDFFVMWLSLRVSRRSRRRSTWGSGATAFSTSPTPPPSPPASEPTASPWTVYALVRYFSVSPTELRETDDLARLFRTTLTTTLTRPRVPSSMAPAAGCRGRASSQPSRRCRRRRFTFAAGTTSLRPRPRLRAPDRRLDSRSLLSVCNLVQVRTACDRCDE